MYKRKHKENCAVAQTSCSFCHDTNQSHCHICGERGVMFTGEDFQEQFCKWLFGKHNNKYTCFAHNFKAYDSYFIMQYVLYNCFKVNNIENGGKIMILHCNEHEMKFLDSLNFIHVASKKSPKNSRRDSFHTCLTHQTTKTILAVFQIRNTMTQIQCHQKKGKISIYRTNVLKEDSIGLIPRSGYRKNDVQSVEAQKWMKYLELTRGVSIKRSGFGGKELLEITKVMVLTQTNMGKKYF